MQKEKHIAIAAIHIPRNIALYGISDTASIVLRYSRNIACGSIENIMIREMSVVTIYYSAKNKMMRNLISMYIMAVIVSEVAT